MKKTIIFFLTFLVFSLEAVNIYGQSEPDFVGEVFLKTSEGNTPLEKSPVQIKTKAGASVYIVGIGNVKTKMQIKGCCSNVRVQNNEPIQLIVRAVDNHTDPLSIVKVFQFEKKKKDRRAEIAGGSTFGGDSKNNLKLLVFDAKKYGESSYLLTMNIEQAGEYGVIVTNPNALDERATIVSCFGVDE